MLYTSCSGYWAYPFRAAAGDGPEPRGIGGAWRLASCMALGALRGGSGSPCPSGRLGLSLASPRMS